MTNRPETEEREAWIIRRGDGVDGFLGAETEERAKEMAEQIGDEPWDYLEHERWTCERICYRKVVGDE